MKFAIALLVSLVTVAAIGLASPQPAAANQQYATSSGWIYKSTFTATNEAAQHVVGANGGAVLGCIHATKAVATSTFDVWDSSNATTAGREKLASVSGAAVGSWCFNIEADLGLTYTTTNSGTFTMTYLEHR